MLGQNIVGTGKQLCSGYKGGVETRIQILGRNRGGRRGLRVVTGRTLDNQKSTSLGWL